MRGTTNCGPAPMAAGWCAWPPQDGQANAVLLAFLAEVFGVPRRAVQLLSSHTAPFKKVKIVGMSKEVGATVLARYGG